MKSLPLMLALGAAALLAACGQNGETGAPAPANASHDMSNMAMPMEAAKTGKGAGIVKAIDKTAGTITLEHGPIAEVNWPGMTMAFKAAPALLDSVAVGDKVSFDVRIEGGAAEVTAIARQ